MTFRSESFLLLVALALTNAQLLPSSFFLFADEGVPVNGSLVAGNCSNVTFYTYDNEFSQGFRRPYSICNDPTSSVLFDGNIPTLTGLGGDMWASQLLTMTLLVWGTNEIYLDFGFSGTPQFDGIERVEVVMFNCPEWGIGTQVIRVRTGQTESLIAITDTSCDSLVRLCLPVSTPNQDIILSFFGSIWLHLAEVTFIDDLNNFPTCTPGPITPELFTIPIDEPGNKTSTSVTTHSQTTGDETTTSGFDSTQREERPSSIALATVITAIGTALLTTAIFVLVIGVCKCHPKYALRPAVADHKMTASEGQEQVDGGEGGVAVSDPTYMEVGEGENTFHDMHLKRNEACEPQQDKELYS